MQQQFVTERLPDADALPRAQASPAGHPATTAQLWGQQFPALAASEHEEDARQRGRPPFGLGGAGGSNGATMAQSSSLTSRGVLMPLVYHQAGADTLETACVRRGEQLGKPVDGFWILLAVQNQFL